MTNEAFQSFTEANGWKSVEVGAVGVHKNYPFWAQLQPGRISTVHIIFQTTKGLSAKNVRALAKSLPKGCSFTQPTAGRFQAVCGGVDDLLLENVRRVMDAAAEAFREAGLQVPTACACCRKDGCDSLALWGGAYMPVHRGCIEEKAAKTATSAQINTVNGSYVSGFVGAFLGGLVGVLPTILSVVLLERIVAILYALIPICAYQGYKMLRGKMNKGAFWITCVVSIFHLFSMEQIYFYIAFVREFGLWPSIIDTTMLYWTLATPADIFSDMILSFVFLGLGIWIAWSHIRSTASDAVQNMGIIHDSLTPYTGRASSYL